MSLIANEESRAEDLPTPSATKPRNWLAAGLVIVVWLLLIAFVAFAVARSPGG